MPGPAEALGARLRAALCGLALALAAALGLAGPAAANDEDVDFLTRTLQGLLSDAGRQVRIRGFEGALSARATIRELTIADGAGIWLVMRGLVLDWDRGALLSRRIEVNALTAELIEVRRAPLPSAAGPELPSPVARRPFALPELPVSIRVGELRADRVVLGADLLGAAAAFRIDGTAALAGGQGTARLEAVRIDGAEGRLDLAGGFDNATRRLTLALDLAEGPGGIAAGLLGIPGRPAVRLTARGDDPIAAFRAELSLATDGRERLSGRATFLDTTPEAGVLEGAVFRLELAGDLRPLLAPELHPFFGAEARLAVAGSRAEDGALSLAELSATTGALALDGRAELDAGGLPRLLDLSLRIGTPDGAPVVLPGTQGAARLEQAELLVRFDAGEGPDWAVLGRLERLELPRLALAEVALDARGRLDAAPDGSDGAAVPAFAGTIEFAALGIAAADPGLQAALGSELYGLVSLIAPGGGAPVELAGLALEGETISLTGQGVLAGLAFDGFLEAGVPDLAPFSGLAGRALGGAALATLRGRIEPLTGAFDVTAALATTDLTLDLPEADNLLAGRATIEIEAARDTEGTALRRLALAAGTLAFEAAGRFAVGEAELSARFGLSDLARLGEGYAGALALDLALRQEAGDWQAVLAGDLRDLRIGARAGAPQVAALFAGQTAVRGRAGWREGVTRLEGLALTGPQVAFEVSGVLSPAAQALALRLDRLALPALAGGLAGALAGRVELSGAPGARRLSAELASLGAVRTGVSAVDALLAAGLRAQLAAAEAEGAVVVASLRMAATGLDLGARARLEADGALAVELEGGLDSLGRLARGLEGPVRLDGRLARAAGAIATEVRLSLAGPSALGLNLAGRIGPDLRLALAVAGEVEAAIANPILAPATVQGTVRFEGAVRGPPALDSLRLTARMEGGRYVLPGAVAAFGDIAGVAEFDGGTARLRMSGASLRGGTATAAGIVTLVPLGLDLTVSGQGLRIAQPRLFEGAVSGTIRLAGSLVTGPTASGRIRVEEAEIRIPNSPLSRWGFVPEGLRHEGESAASRATRTNAGLAAPRAVADVAGRPPLPLYLDVELEAPGRIFVRGRGLDAELGGTLRLGGTTADMIPGGAFTLIRGRLDLLGNRFTLTDGSASFIGSFLPVVRLAASTESGGVVTSVILEGPADGPEIRFESVPELPQDEVLARLLFGRALASLSPFQAAQLGLSVATLTGRAEAGFIDRTRRALGLDDLDFTTDARGTTALRAGRYVSERLYTDLSVNSQGRSEVRLQLDLSPSLTLRGRADSAGRSAVGLFFERDY